MFNNSSSAPGAWSMVVMRNFFLLPITHQNEGNLSELGDLDDNLV